MESIINRIIDKKLEKHEIILEKNIISSLFLIDCTLFFENDVDLIDKINKETNLQHSVARFAWLRSKKDNFR